MYAIIIIFISDIFPSLCWYYYSQFSTSLLPINSLINELGLYMQLYVCMSNHISALLYSSRFSYFTLLRHMLHMHSHNQMGSHKIASLNWTHIKQPRPGGDIDRIMIKPAQVVNLFDNNTFVARAPEPAASSPSQLNTAMLSTSTCAASGVA